RIDVDAVAQALVAEADVERHDAPVREAFGGVRQVGRRVEDDRGVLGGELQPATAAACRMAATISSSSWSFMRQATAPASRSASRSASSAEAVRATIATPGTACAIWAVAWMPSRAGMR